MSHNSPERSSTPAADDSGLTITLRDLSKSYGGHKPAVSGVDLDVSAGEFIAFLGPSGSGKTTTLNLIAGLERPTAGEIRFDGRDVSDLPAHRRNLGMLFQNYALFPHMTVAQNVAYPLQERKMSRAAIKDRVSSYLDLVEMGARADAHPAQLSGGQQQRVALARAIVFEPKALLLDEPLGALDKNLRGSLQRELKRIHQEVRSTFLFVTHDQEEAMTLADRIVLFREGGLEQVGTPNELYARPHSLFTAKFLGESNIFPVDIVEKGYVYANEQWSRAGGEAPAHAEDPSDKGFLVIRPETLRFVDAGVSEQLSSVTGVVEQVEYLGAGSKVIVNGTHGAQVTVRVPAGEVVPAPGENVRAAWRPENQWLVRR